MSEEIFYLVAYDKQEKKWRSADEMLGIFVNTAGGDGPVRIVHEDNSVEWREIEDGLEKDIDFENVTTLTEFLRNESSD